MTEQIDGMVKALKKEKADDIKMKDFCVEELNKNERAQELKVPSSAAKKRSNSFGSRVQCLHLRASCSLAYF